MQFYYTDRSSGTNNEFSSTVPLRLQKPFVYLWQNFTFLKYYGYTLHFSFQMYLIPEISSSSSIWFFINVIRYKMRLYGLTTHGLNTWFFYINTCSKVTVLYRNARWWPPPSWIWSLFHIRCICWIVHSPNYLDVKCGKNRCNGSKDTVLFLNSRWQSQPSWILLQPRIWLIRCVERYRT